MELRMFTPIAMCNIDSVEIPVYTSPSVIDAGMLCFVYKKLFVSSQFSLYEKVYVPQETTDD